MRHRIKPFDESTFICKVKVHLEDNKNCTEIFTCVGSRKTVKTLQLFLYNWGLGNNYLPEMGRERNWVFERPSLPLEDLELAATTFEMKFELYSVECRRVLNVQKQEDSDQIQYVAPDGRTQSFWIIQSEPQKKFAHRVKCRRPDGTCYDVTVGCGQWEVRETLTNLGALVLNEDCKFWADVEFVACIKS